LGANVRSGEPSCRNVCSPLASGARSMGSTQVVAFSSRQYRRHNGRQYSRQQAGSMAGSTACVAACCSMVWRLAWAAACQVALSTLYVILADNGVYDGRNYIQSVNPASQFSWHSPLLQYPESQVA
jgi:hypothetical protein